VPLPWVTVGVLAVLLAAADMAVLVALQGAVGAIERDQGPFHSWVIYSAVVAPIFALAVIWALGRVHRGNAARPSSPSSTIRGALLVVLAATAIGIVVLMISTAIDYHLQSELLAKTLALHDHTIGANQSANPAYADGGWSPEQRDTMLVDVKAVGFGSGSMAIANVFLVGWVVALCGGRLTASGRRQRP
jgi:heme/copper-type cytochrome/quinol oxidase subunit 2